MDEVLSHPQLAALARAHFGQTKTDVIETLLEQEQWQRTITDRQIKGDDADPDAFVVKTKRLEYHWAATEFRPGDELAPARFDLGELVITEPITDAERPTGESEVPQHITDALLRLSESAGEARAAQLD